MKTDTALVRPDAPANARWIAALLGFACCGSVFILFADGNLANRLNPLLLRLIHVGLVASTAAALYICWPFAFRRVDPRAPPADLNESSSLLSRAAKHPETTAQASDRRALSVQELQVLDRIPGLISVADHLGNHDYLNQRATDYFGGTAAEFGDAGWMAAVHPDERLATVAAWRQAASSSRPMAIYHRLKKWDGTYGWHHTRVEPDFDETGAIVRWYGLSVDTQGELIAVGEPEEREWGLQSLVDAVPAMLVVTSPSGQVEYVNKTTLEAIGVGLDAFRNLDWMSIIHPEDAQDLANKWMTAVKDGVRFEAEYRQRCADGSYRWWVIKVLPWKSETGEILRWYGAITDIDGLKRIQDALRVSERSYQVMLDAIPALIWRTNAGGVVDYANQRCTEDLGMLLEEMKQFGWLRSVHPDDVAVILERWEHAKTSGQLFAATYRFLFTDGIYRWMQVTAAPLRDPETDQILSWYGVHVNIDEQKRTENALRDSEQSLRKIMETSKAMEATLRSTQLQLARASQIATVAELSASIAHEINQPLAAVAANSHACVLWLAAEPPNLQRARFAAQSIVGDANSAAQVVERIRALFKRAAPEKAVLDINDVIQQVLRLMRDEILEKQVNAKVELDPDLPCILADRVQIQQTLINLIRNATEAMDNLTDRMKLITLSSQREGAGAIIVQIRDYGSGLEDVHRVFEPFYTTKDKGMGVGLSICRSIIEAHGGRLWAAANQGSGATFAFTLPVHAEGIV